MNIIQKMLEYQMKDDVLKYLINGDLLSKDHSKINAAKTALRNNNGIIFINVMAVNKSTGTRTIIAKTKYNSYIYEYDKNSEQLIMKGERKNAIS